MVLTLSLLYHVLLIGALALASGIVSGVEVVVVLVLIALGSAALIGTEALIEPRRRRFAKP